MTLDSLTAIRRYYSAAVTARLRILTVVLAASAAAFGQPGPCTPKIIVGRLTTDAGDGGPATAAQLKTPEGLYEDAAGDLYFADFGNNKVRVIRKDGTIQTVAGTGVPGSAGDGAAAVSAQLNGPVAVVGNSQGELYIAESYGNRVRKVLADGTIQTVAGMGWGGFGGDGGPAILARLNQPQSLALDRQGNLYVADGLNHRVRVVTKDGKIRTVAGSGPQASGQTGDGQPAATTYLPFPRTIAIAPDDTLYISADSGIVSVTPDGILHYLTAISTGKAPADRAPANQVYVEVAWLTLDADGYVLFESDAVGQAGIYRIGADGLLHYMMDTYWSGTGFLSLPDGSILRGTSADQILRYSPVGAQHGTVAANSVIAGQSSRGSSGDGLPGTQALMGEPAGIGADSAGNLYIADSYAGRIRKVDPKGVITTAAGTDGSPTPDGAPALASVLNFPSSLAVSRAGEIYYAELYNYRVRKIKTDGTVVTVAGNGTYPVYYATPSNPGIGRNAASASIGVDAIALDAAGNLYIADTTSGGIWRVGTDGILNLLTTDVGTNWALNLAATPSGVVYYSDLNQNLFRVGTDLKPHSAGRATFGAYFVLAIDDSGMQYQVGPDSVLYRTTLSGAVQALTPRARPISAGGLAFDGSGNLFISDPYNANVLELPSAATCAAQPSPFVQAVVNAANYTSQNIGVPGEIVQIYGTGVGPDTLQQAAYDSSGHLPTTLSGVQVLVDGEPAPLLYASSGVTAVVIPFAVASQDRSTLRVTLNGVASNPSSLQIEPTAPGIFTGDASGIGQGAILNQDYSVNSAKNPAARGSVVMVYMTGLGAVTPAVADGGITGNSPSRQVETFQATVDEQSAEVLYAGTAPGLVAGVGQVNVVIPQAARSGNVPISIFDRTQAYFGPPSKVTVAVQ
jgi:uncharacterized protein (TIGR03437 family)